VRDIATTKDVITIIVLLVLGGDLIILAFALAELRKTTKHITATMAEFQTALLPILEELKGTLANIREVTGNINEMAGDIRHVTEAVGRAGEELEEVVGLVDDVKLKAKANIGGLKAGFRAAFEILTNNFARKGGQS
jgi:ABC-type transporter Mla subunit MlaD